MILTIFNQIVRLIKAMLRRAYEDYGHTQREDFITMGDLLRYLML
jgi:hypothetical protein